jgi:hypothetical protein
MLKAQIFICALKVKWRKLYSGLISEYLVVLRPSLLLGKRSESRFMEEAGKAAASF